MPTWGELLAGKTPDQVFDEIVADLKGLTPPFPVDDWAPGDAMRTMLRRGLARVVSRLYGVVTDITKGGFLRLAQALAEADPDLWASAPETTWLVLLAKHKYRVTPHPALFTEGLLRFTAEAGAGPYPIAPGQYWASTPGGLRYNNINSLALTLPKGGTVDVLVRAESPGEAYNVAVGQISILNVSLPGVTVSNVAQANGTWITSYGTSRESPKELADRCASRFGAIGQDGGVGSIYAPADMLTYRAKTVSPQVKKVTVWSNYYQGVARPGASTLFLAGDTGPLAKPVVDAVYDKLYPYRNINGDLFVDSCVSRRYAIAGEIEIPFDVDPLVVLDQVATNLLDYQRKAEIGAWIYAAQIIEEIMTAPHVINFKPSAPLFDTQLGRNEVVLFVASFTTKVKR